MLQGGEERRSRGKRGANASALLLPPLAGEGWDGGATSSGATESDHPPRLFPIVHPTRASDDCHSTAMEIAWMREGQKRDVARELRRAMTDAEHRLWRVIRLRQVSGCKFRRQCPIGPYVADFVCLERLLVVEVDGGQHCDSRTDLRRDAYLRSQRFRVLRFWNHDVLGNLSGVFLVIEAALAAPTPTLPRKRGRERSGAEVCDLAPTPTLPRKRGRERSRSLRPCPHPNPPPQAGEGAEPKHARAELMLAGGSRAHACGREQS